MRLDHLIWHKSDLEHHLKKRLGELFEHVIRTMPCSSEIERRDRAIAIVRRAAPDVSAVAGSRSSLRAAREKFGVFERERVCEGIGNPIHRTEVDTTLRRIGAS